MTKLPCPFNSRNYRNSEVSAVISAPGNQPAHPLPCGCSFSQMLLTQLPHPHGSCSLTSPPARVGLVCISLFAWASTPPTRHPSPHSRHNLVGPQDNRLTYLGPISCAQDCQTLKQHSLLFCFFEVLWGNFPKSISF